MKQNTVITIVVVLLVGAVAFFAGMKYQQKQQAPFRQFGNGQIMRFGGGAMKNGFRPIAGEIIGVDEKSVTVKLSDGSSKIVLLSTTTNINTATKVDRTELKVGQKIAAFGSENSDGSVTAQNIQLNPMMRSVPANEPLEK